MKKLAIAALAAVGFGGASLPAHADSVVFSATFSNAPVVYGHSYTPYYKAPVAVYKPLPIYVPSFSVNRIKRAPYHVYQAPKRSFGQFNRALRRSNRIVNRHHHLGY